MLTNALVLQISYIFLFAVIKSSLFEGKKTASIINTKETMWFQRKVSVLKTAMTMMVNTVNETASCMTFNWIRLNGPPFCMAPIRLAGTMNEYSNKAMPHGIRMTRNSGRDNKQQDGVDAFHN